MKRFLRLAHRPSCDHTCSNTTNSHMIAELAQPRIGTNVPMAGQTLSSRAWWVLGTSETREPVDEATFQCGHVVKFIMKF